MEVREDETREEKTDANEKIKVGKRILGDIKYLKGSKLGKATQILDGILKFEFFSFNTMKRFIMDEPGTELFAAVFLYHLQQTTKKVTIDHVRVLAILDISSHLTTNTFAKHLFYYRPWKMSNQNMRTQVQEFRETKRQKLLARIRPALGRKKLKTSFVEKLHPTTLSFWINFT